MPKKLTGTPRLLALVTIALAVGLTAWMFAWAVFWAPATLPK